ncbi:MAG TPA: ribokinase [Geminicoccaceae bacterium]|nr:ribokinase [Geminicoccaceae bacterium]
MILVFGSLNADLVFRVPALPRPGETVLCPGYALEPGGKGANQAAAAAKAGAAVRMVGCVGNDSFGDVLRKRLAQAGVDCAGVAATSETTGVAVIGVDPAGENQIIVASGANLAASAAQVGEAELHTGVTLLCQNEVPPEATFALLERAARHGARTILNLAPAAPVPPGVLDALNVLVVNEIEAAMAAGRAAGVPGDPQALAANLAARHDLVCVVTLGAAGAIARGPAWGWGIGSLPVEPVDTTGAGDAFVGVLAASLDGAALPEALPAALRRASVAAGLACTRVGAQTSQPTAAEIAARLPDLAPATPLE